jgi:hypothetical protein
MLASRLEQKKERVKARESLGLLSPPPFLAIDVSVSTERERERLFVCWL